MSRPAVSFLVASLCVASALLAVVVAPGCGPSQLSKDYAAYDQKAEAILEREKAVLTKLLALYNDQSHSETPDPKLFKSVVTGESVPFYDAMKGEVAAAAPSQPGLASPQETLVKYAERRAALAHAIADGVDVLVGSDPWHEVDAKDTALASAMSDYAQRVQGRAAPPDQRFSLIQNSERDFQRLCVEPMRDGRLTAEQMGEVVKTQIQSKIREARSSQFDDDDEGRALRASLVAADEYFDAVQRATVLMESLARRNHDIQALVKEGDDLYKKFMDEMKHVRDRM